MWKKVLCIYVYRIYSPPPAGSTILTATLRPFLKMAAKGGLQALPPPPPYTPVGWSDLAQQHVSDYPVYF